MIQTRDETYIVHYVSVAMAASTSIMKHALEFLIEPYSSLSAVLLKPYTTLRSTFFFLTVHKASYGIVLDLNLSWKASCTQALLAA